MNEAITLRTIIESLGDTAAVQQGPDVAARWAIWRAEKARRAADDRGRVVAIAAVFAALSTHRQPARPAAPRARPPALRLEVVVGWNPRDIACRELVELLTEDLDGVLPPDEMAAVDAHLDGCGACRTYLDQMSTTIAVLGSMPVETLSDAARDTLLTAFAERAGSGSDDRP